MSASRAVASTWMEGSVVVSVVGQRRSMIEGIVCISETQENAHVSEVGEGKKI
jgi:hypothetical protein